MTDQTQEHEEKETLAIDVVVGEHKARTATPLFKRTRQEYMDKVGHRCWICGADEKESGEPLQLHHRVIERCFAEEDIDWGKVAEDVPDFQWDTFNPKDPYTFVDNCHYNGVVLCRKHHTERDSGTHMLPFNLWVMQRYLKNGTRFSPTEVIEHYVL